MIIIIIELVAESEGELRQMLQTWNSAPEVTGVRKSVKQKCNKQASYCEII